ncbi:MAG: hypothetical protein NVS2B3_10290 [Vulcanimicrobiaceae bacterium]
MFGTSSYADFTKLATHVCETPIAFVDLHASSGGPRTAAPEAFYRHTIERGEYVEIGDTTLDERFASYGEETGGSRYRFYAGMPLLAGGRAIGALSTFDYRARSLTTGQRSAFFSLAASLARYVEAQERDVLEHVAQPIFFLHVPADGTGATISFCNRALGDLFGYSATELVGRSPRILHGPKTDPFKIGRLRAAIASRTPGTEIVYLYARSGAPLLIEIRDRPLDDRHRVVSFRDLTRVHHMQAELVRSNDRLRSLYVNNRDAILTLDAAGHCLDANAAAEDLLDRSRDALQGTAYRVAAIDAMPEIGEAFAATLRAESAEFSSALSRDDGRRIDVEWRAIPIVTHGTTDGAYLVGRDVTAARVAAALRAEDARRTQALCSIAATYEWTDAEQIDAALRLVSETLGMQSAYVCEFDEGAIRILNAVGEPLVRVGQEFALGATLVRRCVDAPDAVVDFDDLWTELDETTTSTRFEGWHGYIAAPLLLEKRPFGALAVASRSVRTFGAGDRDFVRLAAALIAATLGRQLQRRHLDRLAFYDALTGLANRVKILQDIESAISFARRHERKIAIHSIDLDGFKAINDRAGHATGDLALREVARRLTNVGRGYDVPARYGGDEFVFLQSDLDHASEARTLGERLVAHLALPYELAGETFALGASLGIAVYPADGTDARTLLENADLALYRAKAKGKHRVEMDDGIGA